MAQCEKVMDNGQRCSNNAVPGSRYCQTHGRISFKPVPKPAEAPPPSRPKAAPPPAKRKQAPAAKKRQPEPPMPGWQAVPSPSGQTPVFPGLRPDDRNILVAPQGVIWLEGATQDGALSQFSRLVRLLGLLSDAFPLPGQVRLLRQGDAGDCVVSLTPAPSGPERTATGAERPAVSPSLLSGPKNEPARLSAFYDAAAAAARLVEGRLYIGQDQAYVYYRDDGAPRGYDVPAFKGHTTTGQLLLIAPWGSHLLNPGDMTEEPLAQFCLRVRPVPSVAGPPPERVWTLTPVALYPILAKYFRAHRLRYALARLGADQGELILLEVSPRPDTPAGSPVPAFVLDYLARLPRVAVLVAAHRADCQRILVHWKHRYPLRLAHVAGAFAPDDLVLLVADHYPNLRVNPAPQFFDGDRLTDAHVHNPAALQLTPRPAGDAPAVQVPVLLRPDNGKTPPISALVLDAEEMAWLRQVLYRLPGESFAAYSVCLGQNGAVLISLGRPVDGIPFGTPLRRYLDTELFIPLHARLAPDLPWVVLRPALEIQDSVYTFLTPEYRLDLPFSAFAPLSRGLLADPHRPRVKFELRTGISLPDLRWTPPPAPPAEAQTHAEPAREGGQRLLSRMLGQRARRPPPPPPGAGEPKSVEFDPKVVWPKQARTFEEAGDYLSAAVCYSLAGDVGNSARCYRRAAIAPASGDSGRG